MKNVLVTGGAGFIGSNFVRYLLQVDRNVRLVNLDALTYAGSLVNIQNLPDPERHQFIRGDISDRELVEGLFHRYEIDTVVHFAAETHVDRSILGPAQFIQTNIIGTFTLLEAARKTWVQEKMLPLDAVRFHHVSTDEVFGTLSQHAPAFTETTPYAPRSPYAASKASSDHLVRSYFHTYGLPISITNCSNNYGPYQFPEKLIPLMIVNALNGSPLPVYGDGLQVRDWLYVEDHCEAILRVITRGRVGETYCIGGDNQPTNLEIIHKICGQMDELLPDSPNAPHSSLIRFVPDRPGHDRRYDMDIEKISRDLNWKPRQSLGSGLQKTIEWYLRNQEWVTAVTNQSDFEGWIKRNYSMRDGKK